ncbi:MAG: zinc dependent phospholipase C family protein [Lachnospiraceae bacterium]|nr:zinc dependent phospholipase C family protein [Lachnospiraceae bacterium]
MPAFYTHYIFGKLGYQDLEESMLKEMIRKHKKVYAFGLSGPDIFFYFAIDQLLLKRTPGSRMHEEKCGIFLRRMLNEALALSAKEREIGLAYLAGFIGHYALDVSCHPHVYAYIEEEAARISRGEARRVGEACDYPLHKKLHKEDRRFFCGENGNESGKKIQNGQGLPEGKEAAGTPGTARKRLRVRISRKPRAHRVSAHEKTGIHFRYECAMDHYFLEHYISKNTGQLKQGKMVYLLPQERRIIARMVASAYNKTYDRPNMSEASVRAVLFSVRMVQHLIRDPYGRKERVFSPIEKFVYHHPFFAGLFVNDNCYGIGWDEWAKMNLLFLEGRKEYGEMLDALAKVVEAALGLEGSQMAYGMALKEFVQVLGSRSYHTGEPV